LNIRRRYLALLSGVALLAAACGGAASSTGGGGGAASGAGSQAKGPAGNVITIGAAVSKTGAFAAEGQLMRDAYRFWADKVNAEGGIPVGGKKYKVKLIMLDDESNGQTSANLVQKLITEDHVNFLFGPYSSGISIQTGAIGEKYHVLQFTPLASAPSVFSQGYKYLFGTLGSAYDQMDALLAMAKTLSPAPTRVAITTPDDLFPLVTAQGVDAYAKKNGFDVVYFKKYPKNQSDFSSILAEVKAANPQIYIDTGYTQSQIQIVHQMKDLRFNPSIVAFPTVTAVPDFLKALGPEANGVFGVEQWIPQKSFKDPNWGSADAFVKAFDGTHKYHATYFTASSVACGEVLQEAIEKAGSLDASKLLPLLHSMTFDTVFGPIQFAPDDMNAHPVFPVRQFQNGKVVLVWPAAQAEAKPIYPKPNW
jgi:branched-chain amino acid transport system substrate-binding protein